MDKNYWRNYYKSHKIGEKPSLFAEFVLERLKGEEYFANSSDFMESNAESLESSLRGDLSPKRALRKQLTHTCKSIKTAEFKNENIGLSHHCERSEAIQKSIESAKDSNVLDCHDSAIVESRNDDSPYRHCEHSQNVKQSIYENNFMESRQIERAESTESLKDSNIMDYHEFNKLNSHNDENDTDSHEAFTSSNDEQRANPHDSHDFYNNDATLHNSKSHKDSDITLLELGCGNGRDAIFFAKNGIKVIAIDQVADEISYLASLYAENPHFISGDFTDLDTIFKGLDSHSASSLSSLRGDNSPKRALRKQLIHTCKSINNAESSDFNLVDCHDSAVAESRNDNSVAIPSNTNSRNDEWRADYNKSQGKSFNDGISGDSTHSARFHCIYSRFTLHSITHSQQETLLSQIPRYLAKDGILAIEARGLKNSLYQKGEAVLDEADAFIYDSHYRRFVDLERLCEVLRSLDFHIEFAKEERGFAPFNGEDDYFFRIIATRGGAELVFFVCFQPRISTLYASTKWHKPLENVA